ETRSFIGSLQILAQSIDTSLSDRSGRNCWIRARAGDELGSNRNQRVLTPTRSSRRKRKAPAFPSALRANISETSLVPLINEQKGEKEEIRDEREFSWCCSFLWGFGCRGTKRR